MITTDTKELPVFGITITKEKDGSGGVVSELSEALEPLERLLLAMELEGIDVATPAMLCAIERAVRDVAARSERSPLRDKEYHVTTREVWQRTVRVAAPTREEAVRLAHNDLCDALIHMEYSHTLDKEHTTVEEIDG